MSQANTIQTRSKTVKKQRQTALDYVAPFNHLHVPQALDFAKNSFYNKKIYGVAKLAIKNGVSQTKIAEILETDTAFLSRSLHKGEDK